MKTGQTPLPAALDEPAPLELALVQSQDVKAKVEKCADDIAAANGEVRTRIAGGVNVLSAHKALATGKEVEGKVQECATDLQEVTRTLAQGVAELQRTEDALSEAQADLADTKTELASVKEAEKEARQQALHDPATGLPNRDLFDTRLEQALSMAERHGWTLAVMFLDLDRFKDINDAHGHSAGDAVLQEVAARLSGHVRAEDTVCRNGGDEFLYLLVNPGGTENIQRIARSIIQRIAQPIEVAERQLVVEASIGIAVYPQNGRGADNLIAKADAAMYVAKKGPARYALVGQLVAVKAAA